MLSVILKMEFLSLYTIRNQINNYRNEPVEERVMNWYFLIKLKTITKCHNLSLPKLT
jgi:hypothetical protein